jgi:hypothetical protein
VDTSFAGVNQYLSMAEREELISKRSEDPEHKELLKEMRTAGWCVGVERMISQIVTQSGKVVSRSDDLKHLHADLIDDIAKS